MSNEVSHSADHGCDHGSTKSYLMGFVLSIILTLIPFYAVSHHVLPAFDLYVLLAVTALCQLFVQVHYFLHLNTHSSVRWNLIAFIFTMVVVLILVLGSFWIMINLNYNMIH